MLIESRNESKGPASGKPAKGSQNRWHSVTIVSPASACAAAHACKEKRFLSTEAPRLPLADCDVAVCKCKYRHFADRRSVEPRRTEGSPRDPKAATTNRRTKKGRRAED